MTRAIDAYEAAMWRPIQEAVKGEGPILATRIGNAPWGYPAMLIWLDGRALYYGPGWYQFDRAPAAVGNINGGVPKRPTHFRPAFSTPQDPEAGHDPSVG